MSGIVSFPTGGKVKLDCDQCESKLNTKQSLKMNIHEDNCLVKKQKKECLHGDQLLDLICKQCGKVFRQIRFLKQHMITHSGAKPFKCEQCSKSFNLRGNLKLTN